MNYTLTISQADLAAMESALAGKLAAAVQPVQEAMAEQYLQVVHSNFGPTGIDRPWPWEPLSDRSAVGRAYIKKVGRTYATLFETGAMFSTLHKDSSKDNAATVSMMDSSEVPYATRHHYGGGNLPPRRVFPMNEDGSCTDKTMEMVVDAAKQTIKELFK